MSEFEFDPYESWLNIPGAFRPLNHYLLLGLNLFEDDAEKIRNACDQRMELIRQHQSGPRGEACERLLTELAKAKQILLSDDQRLQYNKALEHQLACADSLDVSHEPIATQRPEWDSRIQLDSDSAAEQEDVVPDEIDGQSGNLLSPFNILMFSSIALVAMIITVGLAKWLTDESQSDRNSQARTEAMGGMIADAGPSPGEPDSAASGDVNSSDRGGPAVPGQTIEQQADASLLLRPATAKFTGDLLRQPGGISDWDDQLADLATWQINVADRRTSFFYCEIQYIARAECGMQLEIESPNPVRRFTLYPSEQPFTERFLIRLGEGPQSFSIGAVKLEPGHDLIIQQIRLVPK